jgi:hypothetical protein
MSDVLIHVFLLIAAYSLGMIVGALLVSISVIKADKVIKEQGQP